jgi:simple sugar transport system permease protein
LCLAAGAIGGAVWGLLPGLLKAKRGVHEVISTIMLNYIAFYLVHYLVTNPLKDVRTMAPQTPEIQSSAILPCIAQGSDVHWGILIALLCAVGFWFLMHRTVIGYEITAVGLNQKAARVSGVNVSYTIVLAMLLSGALAGLAGAVEILGVHHKFYDQFSPGYGFDSIAVALLGNNSAVGTLLSALLFGALRNGALNMQLAVNTPKEIVTLIQAVIIVFAGIRFFKERTAIGKTADCKRSRKVGDSTG